MRTSVFIFLFMLAFSLPAASAPEAASGVKTAVASGCSEESVSVCFRHSDWLAVKTVGASLPAPARAVRKLSENRQRPGSGIPAALCCPEHASGQNRPDKYAGLLPAGDRPAGVSHSSDYLVFRFLRI